MKKNISDGSIYLMRYDTYMNSLQEAHMQHMLLSVGEMSDSFSARLKYAIKSKGWTHAKLAEESGISIPTINRALHNKKETRLDVKERLADALGVRLEWFLLNDPFMTEEERLKVKEDMEKWQNSLKTDHKNVKDETLRILANECGLFVFPAYDGGIYVGAHLPGQDYVRNIHIEKDKYDQFSENIFTAFRAIISGSFQNLFLI